GEQKRSPTPPPRHPSLTANNLTIDGNTALTDIGQTSQLTARATFSDGTVKDVTSATQWTSTHPSVITISAKGLVTVVQLGRSAIQASYLGKYASVVVLATQSGTSVVTGLGR